MADGFLGRWSQRKQALRDGRVLDEPTAPKIPMLAEPAPAAVPESAAPTPQGMPAASLPANSEHTAPPAPAPTLADVQALKPDSNFAPFLSRDVAPEVRNAAMKKLFADPHYNVMDGLDIYIDDYSVPSPMPAAMLRQMVGAKFLKLFDDEEQAPDHGLAQPASPALPEPAASCTSPTLDPHHDHTDLRLQPDHAAGPARPEREPERAIDPALEPVPPRSR